MWRASLIIIVDRTSAKVFGLRPVPAREVRGRDGRESPGGLRWRVSLLRRCPVLDGHLNVIRYLKRIRWLFEVEFSQRLLLYVHADPGLRVILLLRPALAVVVIATSFGDTVVELRHLLRIVVVTAATVATIVVGRTVFAVVRSLPSVR